MEVSSCVVQGKKMYVVVCVYAYKKQADIGTKLHCELEPANSLRKKAIFVKTKEGDTVDHVPVLLVHALAPEISGGNIVSIEAIVTGEPRSAPEGTWVKVRG